MLGERKPKVILSRKYCKSLPKEICGSVVRSTPSVILKDSARIGLNKIDTEVIERYYARVFGFCILVNAKGGSVHPLFSRSGSAEDCSAPQSWEKIDLRKLKFVVFGELHGTSEGPRILGQTVAGSPVHWSMSFTRPAALIF
jgi:hypothetical protein